MTWVLLITAAWLAVSLPLALVIAHAIRRADRETAGGRQPSADLHVVPDDALAVPQPRAPLRRRVGRG